MMPSSIRLYRSIFILGLSILASSCIDIAHPFSGLPPGPWRGYLMVGEQPTATRELEDELGMRFEEIAGGELPFNFEVTYENDSTFYITFINGEERIRVDDITMGLDRTTARDTLLIRFPVYGTYIKGEFEENIINAFWYDPSRGPDYKIPFVARFGQDYRFTNLRKTPVQDLSGNWSVTFGIDTDDPYPAIGEFNQYGNLLTGTFRTETGDYRFLEGTVQADRMYLSAFDGTHAFMFEAKIQADGSLLGVFRSGNHYKTLWKAQQAEDIALRHPDSLTFLRPGYDRMDFAFPGPDGKTYSPRDLTGKVNILQIMGTWCPNCRDETVFLRDYLVAHPEQDIQVLGVAFERLRDSSSAFLAIDRYRKKLDVPWPVALGGGSSKSEAGRAFPMLNSVISYPTMIIMDESGNVRRIHTGFSGPATSTYDEFVQEFEEFTGAMLAEDGREQ